MSATRRPHSVLEMSTGAVDGPAAVFLVTLSGYRDSQALHPVVSLMLTGKQVEIF